MKSRDDQLAELLRPTEKDGHYFGIIRVERGAEQKCFQFGIGKEAYSALKRALDERPFDQMPGLRHRYYFAGAARLENGRAVMAVRVVQGRDIKTVDVEAPIDLVSNLVWFDKLADWTEADHLVISDPRLSSQS
jgi:hypothetical protein